MQSAHRWSYLLIPGLYAAFGVVWIVVSDRLAAGYSVDIPALARLGMAKGLVFVAASALLLAGLLRAESRRREQRDRLAAETQAALTESEQRFRDLADLLPQSVFECDPRGTFTFWNQHAFALSGYTREEFQRGLNVLDMLIPADRERARRNMQRVLAGESSGGREYTILLKDGSTVPVNIYIAPILREAALVGLRGILADITELKHGEAILTERNLQLEAIRAVGTEITQELDLSALLRLIVRRATEMLHTTQGALFLWDEAQQLLIPQLWPGQGDWVGQLRLRLGESVAGTVAQCRQGMFVNEFPTSPYTTPFILAHATYHAVLGQPLLYRDRLLGVIVVTSNAPAHQFVEHDLQILELFADQAAIALENARLHQAALRRGAELEALLSATGSVMSGLDLEGILDRIVAQAQQMSGAPHVKVLLLDPPAGVLRVGAARGTAHLPGETIPIDTGISATVARTGEVLYSSNHGENPRNPAAVRDRELGIQTYLGLPIKKGTEVLGVLTFNTTTPKEYSAAELAYLTSFATQAAIAIENARLYAAVQQELAGRQQAEEDLRLHSEILQDMAEGVVLVRTSDGTIVYANPTFERLFGYQSGELVGHPVSILNAAGNQSPEETSRGIAEHLETAGVWIGDLQNRKKDGTVFWCHAIVSAFDHSRHGRVWIAVHEDITERKRADEILQEREASLRAILDATADGILVVDATGRVTHRNARFAEIWRIPPDVVATGDDATLLQVALQQLENPEAFLVKVRALYQSVADDLDTLTFKDGRVVERFSFPLLGVEGIRGRVWSFRDITVRKRLEEERLIRSKLESTGILAGGIAHDFNNLLTVIHGSLELLGLPGQEIAPHLAVAKQASLEAHALTQQFLAFAKGGSPVRQAIALAGVLRDAAALALRGSPVACDLSLPDDLWPVEGNAGQLAQVVRNLVLNAREALPAGGRISVRAENVTGPAPGVRITIADPGPGIPADVLPRIFDPYLSTKRRGDQRGMGLGLTICRAIVEQHGGTITVESTVGVGTTVEVTLPAARAAEPPERRPDPLTSLGTGRLLLMDDEALVRTTTGALLRELGHTVELAEHGEQVVALYRAAQERGAPFDAVILDLTVRGGMGGVAALQELRRLDPAVKALASSGYADDPVLQDPARHGFQGALAKPYRLADLREILAQMLRH
jgi:PAS domain S-box-containing protein